MNYRGNGEKLSPPNGDNIQEFAWGNEKNHEYISQYGRFPGQDSKQKLPENEFRTLPLHHPVRCNNRLVNIRTEGEQVGKYKKQE
jgi:hypothetical protein